MYRFSIIISSNNGGRTIRDAIEYISKLQTTSCICFEVIVVSNGSIDNTVFFAESACSDYLLDHPYVIVEIKQASKSEAFLIGIEKSNFEYVIICDDDNFLFNDYLLHASNLIKNQLNVNIWGGLGIILDNNKLPDHLKNIPLSTFALGPQGGYRENEDGISQFLWGAGMIIRKSYIQKLIKAGFVPLLGRKYKTKYLSGEDAELCLVNVLFGGKNFYSSKLKYYHNLDFDRFTKEKFYDFLIRNTLCNLYLDMYHWQFKRRWFNIFLFFYLRQISTYVVFIFVSLLKYFVSRLLTSKVIYLSKGEVLVFYHGLIELTKGYRMLLNCWKQTSIFLSNFR